jgi:hypothetical protein
MAWQWAARVIALGIRDDLVSNGRQRLKLLGHRSRELIFTSAIVDVVRSARRQRSQRLDRRHP